MVPVILLTAAVVGVGVAWFGWLKQRSIDRQNDWGTVALTQERRTMLLAEQQRQQGNGGT